MPGVEPVFGLNNFKKPKYLNESETIENNILALLFGRPGYFPSMPDLGMNIPEMMYSFWDEINVESIKANIIVQCSAFGEFVINGSLDIIKSTYNNQPLLLISLPIVTKNKENVLNIGITLNKNGNIAYNSVFN